METNLLRALLNLKNANEYSLPELYGSSNRMNNMGIALEYFVKDAFCNSFSIVSPDKEKEHSKHLSYIGNANNPPDFIIKGGDAVEVKKMEGFGDIALNSSYPKDKLYSDSTMITQACKDCEKWDVKDFVYVVGTVKESEVKSLWFVYGNCYAADRSVYEKTRTKIIEGVNSTIGIEAETNELGRINRVDPLGITYLRIRGMWAIDHPKSAFDYAKIKPDARVIAIILEDKYSSFPAEDKKAVEELNIIRDAEIKDPNNPAKFLKAKIIEF